MTSLYEVKFEFCNEFYRGKLFRNGIHGICSWKSEFDLNLNFLSYKNHCNLKVSNHKFSDKLFFSSKNGNNPQFHSDSCSF
jgi:hypothetical protein